MGVGCEVEHRNVDAQLGIVRTLAALLTVTLENVRSRAAVLTRRRVFGEIHIHKTQLFVSLSAFEFLKGKVSTTVNIGRERRL